MLVLGDDLRTQLLIRPAQREEAPIILDLWQNSARWLNSKGIYQMEAGIF